LSQQELAKKSELTQSIISELENGDYNPSLEVLSKIATAFGITPDIITKRIIFWKMIETVDYILQKTKNVDILKAMKLLFLIDYETFKNDGQKLVDLEYWRWHR
jgi:transcriptional regulator with XRE-family HTH domain